MTTMNTLEKKIQKKVDEVNALIEKASNSDSDNSYEGNLMVVDTNNTWQEPAIYKPIVFRNGVLYIEYYEPYRQKTTKEKILKRNLEFDGYGTLLDIAKQYRSALRKEGIKYAGGGGLKKEVDLFQYPDQQPKKLAEIVDFYIEKYMNDDFYYSDTEKFLKEVESVGYTFNYGLDNEPFALRKKGVELSQVEGYDDTDDEDSGAFNDGGGVMTREEFIKKEIESQKEKEKGKTFKDFRVNVYEQSGNKGAFPFVEPYFTDNFVEALNFAKETIKKQRKYRSNSGVLWATIDSFTPIEKRQNVRYQYDELVRVDEQDINSSKYDNGGTLIGNQKRIDMNHNGKLDAEDFKLLRSSINGAWRKERKYVNHDEDYEVRYARPRLNRTGYKGKRSFDDGGNLDDKLFLVKRENRVIADFKTKDEAINFIYEYELEYPRAELELIDPNFIPKFSKKYVPENRLSESEWMMKHNSSPEARAYSQGGTIQLGGKLHYYDDLYLDYVNNFVSVQGFADHYGISKEKANKIIDLGRENNTPNVLSNMKLALLTELWFAVQQKDVSEYPKLKNQLDKYGIRFSIQNKVSEDAREHRIRKALSISEVHEKVTKIWNEYYKSGKSYAGGGKITFKEKATAIAKNFEGKLVEPKYQKEYGKTYDKEEAKEVGNKIAGSQKAKYDAKVEKGAVVKKGSGNHRMKEVSNLAKKIRKDGEKWTDAIKRAYEQLK